MLYRPPNIDDIPEYGAVQTVLREEFVNPLRKHQFVRADKVMKLRKLLDNLTFAGNRNDVDKVVEELLEFKKNGLDEFAIRLYKDPKESMELIADTVIPHLD